MSLSWYWMCVWGGGGRVGLPLNEPQLVLGIGAPLSMSLSWYWVLACGRRRVRGGGEGEREEERKPGEAVASLLLMPTTWQAP